MAPRYSAGRWRGRAPALTLNRGAGGGPRSRPAPRGHGTCSLPSAPCPLGQAVCAGALGAGGTARLPRAPLTSTRQRGGTARREPSAGLLACKDGGHDVPSGHSWERAHSAWGHPEAALSTLPAGFDSHLYLKSLRWRWSHCHCPVGMKTSGKRLIPSGRLAPRGRAHAWQAGTAQGCLQGAGQDLTCGLRSTTSGCAARGRQAGGLTCVPCTPQAPPPSQVTARESEAGRTGSLSHSVDIYRGSSVCPSRFSHAGAA